MSLPESSTETTTTYEVWQRGVGAFADIPERRVSDGNSKRFALTLETEYNDEEAALARFEMRPVKREFFTVQVTSTRQVVA